MGSRPQFGKENQEVLPSERQLRETVEALRGSEERFRRYFELGLIGMAMTSPTKGVVEVNSSTSFSIEADFQEMGFALTFEVRRFTVGTA